MRCDSCGRQVPQGVFCTACGAHEGQVSGIGDAGLRIHHYAAHPGEHVAAPNPLTTLLPHLASHKVHEFRWALLLGLGFVGVLYATGIIVGAILVSAALVPVLYLVYLYEAQVFQDEPLRVLGLTIGLGAVLGVAMTVIVDAIYSPVVTRDGYASGGEMLISTVLIPIIQIAVMSVPALLLRGMPQFRQTADGLTFGVAAGVGFAGAETIVRFSSAIRDLPLRSDPAQWIYPLLTIAVLIPLLHGSAAGAVVASMWRGDHNPRLRRLVVLGIPSAVVATVAFYVVAQILIDNGVHPLITLGWEAVCVAALLVYIRFLLHLALLQEGEDLGYSPQVCASCHIHIIAAGFCPSCGQALSAAPRGRTAVAPPVAAAPSSEGA